MSRHITYLLIPNVPWGNPDIVDRYETPDRETAVQWFSTRKQLPASELLKIYEVITTEVYNSRYPNSSTK